MFIDFLHIKNNDFKNFKLIIFYWKSWTGKSTYLKIFYNKFLNNSKYLFHKVEKIQFNHTEKTDIFIDEIYWFSWLYTVIKYLLSWKRVFVASHLHPIFFIFIYLFFSTKSFIIEKPYWKIEMYLNNKWYFFSENSILYFNKKYKSSFVDLEIILETWKNNKNFDFILNKFEKNNKIIYSRIIN